MGHPLVDGGPKVGSKAENIEGVVWLGLPASAPRLILFSLWLSKHDATRAEEMCMLGAPGRVATGGKCGAEGGNSGKEQQDFSHPW